MSCIDQTQGLLNRNVSTHVLSRSTDQTRILGQNADRTRLLNTRLLNRPTEQTNPLRRDPDRTRLLNTRLLNRDHDRTDTLSSSDHDRSRDHDRTDTLSSSDHDRSRSRSRDHDRTDTLSSSDNDRTNTLSSSDRSRSHNNDQTRVLVRDNEQVRMVYPEKDQTRLLTNDLDIVPEALHEDYDHPASEAGDDKTRTLNQQTPEERQYDLECVLANLVQNRHNLLTQVEQARRILQQREKTLAAHDKHTELVRAELEELGANQENLQALQVGA